MTAAYASTALGRHVYLARHGETVWNVAARRQGRSDSPLTPDGVAQAYRNAELLVDAKIGTIFASPLGRAFGTAMIIGARLVVPVTIVNELAEIDHGAYTGWTEAQMWDAAPDRMAARARDRYNWAFPDGESYRDADCRAKLALGRMAAHGNGPALIVSHEMIGRMVLRQLLGLPRANALALRHPHDVVYDVDLCNRVLRTLPQSTC
jgi:broad specificity phosphatase PhoE